MKAGLIAEMVFYLILAVFVSGVIWIIYEAAKHTERTPVISGPERIECVNIINGETFRYRLVTVERTGWNSVKLTDEDGWERNMDTNSSVNWKCRGIPV